MLEKSQGEGINLAFSFYAGFVSTPGAAVFCVAGMARTVISSAGVRRIGK